MPRKTRAKFKAPVNKVWSPSPSRSDSIIIRNPFTTEDGDITATLKSLNEMFDGKVDGDAIFTIFSACDFNVNETIEALISVSNETSSSHRNQQRSSHTVTESVYSTDYKDVDKCLETRTASLCSSGQFRRTEPTTEKHDSCDNYSDLDRKLCSLSFKDSFSSHIPDVGSHLKWSDVPHNRKAETVGYFESSCEPLPVSSDVINRNTFYSYNPNYVSASVGVTDNVPSCSDVERSPINSHIDNKGKTYFPHQFPQAQLRASDRNHTPFFYNQCQSSAPYVHTDSPPKFITPLFRPHRPKEKGKVIDCISLKNKCSVPCKKNNDPKLSLESDFHKRSMIKEVIDKIIINCRVLIIMRGLPGSGKSVLASKLQYSGVVYSTDDYFYKRGRYCFKWAKLSEAHEWNRRRAARAMGRGVTPVIIDNTNVERWEMKPYVVLGLQFNYDIHILEPDTPWKFRPDELSKRNRHKVSKEKIERMLERYDHNVTVESIVESVQSTVVGSSSGLEEISVCDVAQSENATFESEVDGFASEMQEEQQYGVVRQIREVENVAENEFLQSESISHPAGENSIILEAVVHRENEDVPSQSMIDEFVDNSSSSCDISVNESFSNNSASSEMAATSSEADGENKSSKNGSTEGLDELQNFMCLKELLILSEQGNEECQTSSNQLSPSCSSHDSSNWEVITNQEDDFLWSSNPQTEFQKVEGSEIIYGEQSSTNKTELEFTEGDPVKELLISENHLDDEIDRSKLGLSTVCENTVAENEKGDAVESVKDVGALGWGGTESSIIPKPRREPASLPPRKACLSTYPNSGNYSLFKKHRTHTEWGSIAEEEENSGGWNDDSAFSEHKSEKSVDTLLPKPQRNFMSNTGISSADAAFHKILKRGESPQSMSLETVPESEEFPEQSKPFISTRVSPSNSGRKRRHDSLLGNLISDSNIEIDWKFPDFVSEMPDLPGVETSRKFNTTTCSVTQTEPQDFIFLHQTAHMNDNLRNEKYTILIPSSPSELSDTKDTNKLAAEGYSDMSVPKIARFDKSTTTCDIPESMEAYEKLQLLQDCFPDISFEDLKLHFETFHGDTERLINALLDWGYKYNIDNKCTASASNRCKLEETSAPLNNQENATNDDLAILSSKISPVPEMFSKSKFDYFKVDSMSSDCSVDISVSDTLKIDVKKDRAFIDPSIIPVEKSNELQDLQSSSSASQTLQLKLDPAFVLQLEEYFGPVEQGTPSMPSDHGCVVRIDMDFAREIHKRLCQTVQKSSTDKSDIKDVFDTEQGFGVEEKKFDISNFSQGSCDHFNPDTSEHLPKASEMSFAEIMDHEYALQISETERLKSQKLKKNNVATRLKKEKLYRRYPAIDRRALNELFEANKFSLKNTVIALEADVGRFRQDVEMDSDLCDESSFVESNEELGSSEDVLQDFVSENWNDWIEPSAVEGINDTESTGLDDFSIDGKSLREEAHRHHSLHRKNMESAQRAYSNGKIAVAAYYRQRSHYHLGKYKEYNSEAVEIIMEENREKNPSPLVLDLHGLYVPEAIQVLEKFIKLKKTEYLSNTDTDPLTISVITGHGMRSVNGPKLKTCVMDFLKSKGYRFDSINSGMFNVLIAQK